MISEKQISNQIMVDKAVKELEITLNDMSINPNNIKKAFLLVHPYLLNMIAKGLLLAVNDRQHDRRINMVLLKRILEG